MSAPLDPTDLRSRLRASLTASTSAGQTLVLAVSGGDDSMVLLSAAAAVVPSSQLVVATYDHGTGPAATSAAALVQATAARLGIGCEIGRASMQLRSEADLRDARWSFLREVARARGAAICTAHTRDDQIETVLMRILRGSGARGLVGLYAESPIVRPLIGVTRAEILRYAEAEGLAWMEDPSNATRTYLRNRVRHDLLPALRGVWPTADADILDIAHRAAQVRADVESIARELPGVRVLADHSGLNVAATAMTSGDASRLFWPPIAARVGIALDRRGLERLVDFTQNAHIGARVQIAGGWQVVRSRTDFELRPLRDIELTVAQLLLSEVTVFGVWRFKRSEFEGDRTPWTAVLPSDRPLTIRRWRAGDAMQVREGGRATKVKRLLSEAGVTGHNRAGWPVVLSGEQIVWIPGVRCCPATAASSGTSVRRGLPFLCEFIHR